MKTPSAKSTSAKQAPVVPTNMAEAGQVSEQFHKLAVTATDLKIQIADSERRTAELKVHLAGVQKAFSELRPKFDGVVSMIETPVS